MDEMELAVVRADRIREALFSPARQDRCFCYVPAEDPESKPLARSILPGNMVSHHGSTEA